RDGTVKLWDPAAVQGPVIQARFKKAASHPAILASNGKRSAVAGGDGTVTIRDLATGGEIRLKSHEVLAGAMAFTPDGATLATAAFGDRTVKLWDPVAGKERLAFQVDRASHLIFSPDGKTLATSNRGVRVSEAGEAARPEPGRVELWDTA